MDTYPYVGVDSSNLFASVAKEVDEREVKHYAGGKAEHVPYTSLRHVVCTKCHHYTPYNK